MSNKLFVGGLSWGTDRSSLMAAFSAFGEVTAAEVVLDQYTGHSRGFGFVTFRDSREASAAVSTLDGADLDGCAIQVNIAQDRPRAGAPRVDDRRGAPPPPLPPRPPEDSRRDAPIRAAGLLRELVQLEGRCHALRRALGLPAEAVDERSGPEARAVQAAFAAEGAELFSVHTDDGTCVWASDSSEQLFGWKPDELVGHRAQEFCHPDDRRRMAGEERPGSSGATVLEYRLRTRDGGYRWVESHSTPSAVPDGAAESIRFTRDITLQVERQQQLEERIGQLLRAGANAHQDDPRLLRVCAWCKAMGEDWLPMEQFFEQLTHQTITHGICPDCFKAMGGLSEAAEPG